jgi:hypothetical protein
MRGASGSERVTVISKDKRKRPTSKGIRPSLQ